jgi:hypothetical protein
MLETALNIPATPNVISAAKQSPNRKSSKSRKALYGYSSSRRKKVTATAAARSGQALVPYSYDHGTRRAGAGSIPLQLQRRRYE